MYIKLQFNTNICVKRQILCSWYSSSSHPRKRGIYVYDACFKIWICPGQSNMATRGQIPTGSQGSLKCPGLTYFGKTSKNNM